MSAALGSPIARHSITALRYDISQDFVRAATKTIHRRVPIELLDGSVGGRIRISPIELSVHAKDNFRPGQLSSADITPRGNHHRISKQ
ncbi:hypothetical protein QMZ05_39910 [Bradyrhizobium sp. INPA03-11B]